MDLADGVTHRGQDLAERQKKQKKAAKATRTLLKKTRFNRPANPYNPSVAIPILVETPQ